VSVIAALGVLGYGYWFASTHASLHVQVDAAGSDVELGAILPGREYGLLDAHGTELARALGDEHYHYLHLSHPTAGDCHRFESAAFSASSARRAWFDCFAQISSWIPKWIDSVRMVRSTDRSCDGRAPVPARVRDWGADWWFWWVPHPHIGGKPYRYYSLRLRVDEAGCPVGDDGEP